MSGLNLSPYLSAFGSSAVIIAIIAGAAIGFGGPAVPPPLAHIGAAFDDIDFSDAPPVETLTSRNGSGIALRRYGVGDDIVIALHGSGGSGLALHPLASALAEAGFAVIAPDIRGHGETGRRGDVDYRGQTDDDLSDLIAAVRDDAPNAKITLIGFSMGGGLALRFAANRPDGISGVALLSPYLAHDAPPNTAPNPFARAGVWASAGVARIIALSMLNRIGIDAFDHLAVVRFATRPQDADAVAPYASHRLLASVNSADWAADIKALSTPMALLVGEEDELHAPKGYETAVRPLRPEAIIRVVAGVDHIGLSLNPDAHAALIGALRGR